MASQKNRDYRLLVRSRSWLAVAEQFGWVIAGTSAAYSIAGAKGIIAIQLCMLVTATIASRSFCSRLGHNLTSSIIFSMKCRMIALLLLVSAITFHSLLPLLLSGMMSGMFVGNYWPGFYELQRRTSTRDTEEQALLDWYVFEKFLGAVLPLFAVLLLIHYGETVVVVLGLSSIVVAHSLAKRIREPPRHIVHDSSNRLEESLAPLTFLYCASEGMAYSSLVMSGRLSLITETVDLGLPGIVSLGIVVGFVTLCGAFVPCVESRLSAYGDSTVIKSLFTLVAIVATAYLCLVDMGWVKWVLLYLATRFSASVLFPMTITRARELIDQSGGSSTGVREYYRNVGRVFGAVLSGTIWVTGGLSLAFLPSMCAYIAYIALTLFDKRTTSREHV
jgi:hypothetical protein